MTTELLQPLERLRKDIRDASIQLSPTEIRYLVDAYYQMQDDRKRDANQVLALTNSAEPHAVIGWLQAQHALLEGELKKVLDAWSSGHPVGRWSKSIVGIGPVISSGLLANIDIEQAPTAGHIWRFAGLDPTSSWEKGQKRPWNARLKVICWHIGMSLMRTHNHPQSFYGPLYEERKAYEQTRNDAGELAEQARAKLERYKIGKDTEAYKAYSQGKLPALHIDARARRWVTKLFLAHFHQRLYEHHYGKEPPLPYVLTLPNHAHRIEAPE